MTALADRRSLIIERLVELMANFTIQLAGGPLNPGLAIKQGAFEHNRGELPAEKVPGVILLDADETRDQRFTAVPGRQLPVLPQVMRMTPEIYIVLDVRKPPNDENVGEDLNTVRAALLNLVLHDEPLQTLVGANGQIIYDGCVTDLARNRTMKGQMGLSITFVYPFNPNALIGA